ncbi:MAG: acyltransferase [Aggregatilineales bacterium]
MYIHPSADVEDGAEIGAETKIWHLAHIRRQAQVGANCVIGRGVFVDSGVKIGNAVKIQNYVSIYHGVTIEDGVFVGPHVVFTNDKLPRAINQDGTPKDTSDWIVSETTIGYGASLGANAVIVCGVKIGKWAMVGAGSVVTRDIEDYGLVVGNPARLIGYVNEDGTRRE